MKNRFIRLFFVLALFKMFSLSLFASCSVDHNRSFIVNEFNTLDKWVELYANAQNLQSPISNWSLTVCTFVGCETDTFDFDINNGSFFVVLNTFSNVWHAESLDMLIKDSDGNVVDYFNITYETNNGGTKITTQEAEAVACGLDIPCNYFTHSNNGQRDFLRVPDGACTLDDTGINNGTPGTTDDPADNPIEISISNVIQTEGNVGTSNFSFLLTLLSAHTSDIFITYSTQALSASENIDYVGAVNQVVLIPAGSTSASVEVGVIGDTDIEIDETFDIILQATTVGTFLNTQATGLIINDDTPQLQHKFDAWDTFRNINDRAISTKISDQAFQLSLASLDETDNYQSFQGTVCTQLYDRLSGLSASVWQKSLFPDINSTTISFNLPSSHRYVGVRISWKKGVDEACPLVNEDNTTVSSDDFAIRPKEFFMRAPLSAVAGVDFNIGFVAGLDILSPSVAYNETEGTSFNLNINETNPLCLTGAFTPSLNGWSFSNGGYSTSRNYSEVGSLDINLSESSVCQNRFAGVDCHDKNVSGMWNTDTDLAIKEVNQNLNIIPHHFKVESELFDFNSSDFTYLSQDLQMSARINATVTAQNEQNLTTQNYHFPCYAKAIDLNISHNNISSSKLTQVRYIVNDANDINSTLSSVEKNAQLSISYPSSNFTSLNKGKTDINIFMNFDRNEAKPVNPFEFFITSFGVSDGDANETDITGVEHLFIVDKNASFYYGRLRGNDLVTTSDLSYTLELEVYDDNLISSFPSAWKRNSLYWYRNEYHSNPPSFGNVHAHSVELNTQLSGSSDGAVSTAFSTPASGVIDMAISTTHTNPVSRMYHLDIDTWLWYIPQGFGNAYEYINGASSCLDHPCFQYTFNIENNASIIQSGDFNGTIIPDKNRGDYQRTGVKVFR